MSGNTNTLLWGGGGLSLLGLLANEPLCASVACAAFGTGVIYKGIEAGEWYEAQERRDRQGWAMREEDRAMALRQARLAGRV